MHICNPRRMLNQFLQQIAFWYILPVRFKVFLQLMRGVHFDDPWRAWIGDYVIFDSVDPTHIHIGKDVWITSGCKIYVHEFDNRTRRSKVKDVIIEDNVFIGAGSIIVRGVRIGKGAKVGAGSIVNKDVAPHTLVGGNPARFIKKIPP
ncbi:MAG: acyltransferase [DPANN group archaeon]|nr:acyltransferase [DPANN group archaeon]